MVSELLIHKQIHKATMGGNPLCGIAGRVRISYSGALLLVTCPACQRAMTPDVEAQRASIAAAAAAYRAKHV